MTTKGWVDSEQHTPHYAKTPPPDFLELCLLEFDFDDDDLLLLFERLDLDAPWRNLRCIIARRFLLLVNNIPMNIMTDPRNIALPNPYFSLFVTDMPTPEVNLLLVRWNPDDPDPLTKLFVLQREDSDAEQLPLVDARYHETAYLGFSSTLEL